MVKLNNTEDIEPDCLYSANEAAIFLGVHRCTVYMYANHPAIALSGVRKNGSQKMYFLGTDLMAFKSAGLPKKGRKRNDNTV